MYDTKEDSLSRTLAIKNELVSTTSEVPKGQADRISHAATAFRQASVHGPRGSVGAREEDPEKQSACWLSYVPAESEQKCTEKRKRDKTQERTKNPLVKKGIESRSCGEW